MQHEAVDIGGCVVRRASDKELLFSKNIHQCLHIGPGCLAMTLFQRGIVQVCRRDNRTPLIGEEKASLVHVCAMGSREAGYPHSLTVEASHVAMELVSFLYSWYTLTRDCGNIAARWLLGCQVERKHEVALSCSCCGVQSLR